MDYYPKDIISRFIHLILMLTGIAVVSIVISVSINTGANSLNLSSKITAFEKAQEINKYIMLRSVAVDTHYGKCTGVVQINDKSAGATILTAKHCTDEKRWIEVEGQVPYTVVESQNYDLSVIFTPYLENKKEVIISTDLPAIGDKIYHIGRQNESPLVVSGEYHWNEYFNHVVKIDADFGSSGGGLFNDKGELIGIVSTVYDGDQSGRYTSALSNLVVLDFLLSEVMSTENKSE